MYIYNVFLKNNDYKYNYQLLIFVATTATNTSNNETKKAQ